MENRGKDHKKMRWLIIAKMWRISEMGAREECEKIWRWNEKV